MPLFKNGWGRATQKHGIDLMIGVFSQMMYSINVTQDSFWAMKLILIVATNKNVSEPYISQL